MGLLDWREAGGLDRDALRRFRCTTPLPPFQPGGPRDYRKRHPAWWELEVETWVHRLSAPARPPRTLLMGWHGENLGAVSLFEELDGPAHIGLELMALSITLRGKGGGYAREMMRETLDTIADRATEQGIHESLLVGYVWEKNNASQRLLRDMRFEHVSMADHGVQYWERTINY